MKSISLDCGFQKIIITMTKPGVYINFLPTNPSPHAQILSQLDTLILVTIPTWDKAIN